MSEQTPTKKRRAHRRTRPAEAQAPDGVDPALVRAALAKVKPHLSAGLAVGGQLAGRAFHPQAVEATVDSAIELAILYLPQDPDPRVLAWVQLGLSVGMLVATSQPLAPEAPPLAPAEAELGAA